MRFWQILIFWFANNFANLLVFPKVFAKICVRQYQCVRQLEKVHCPCKKTGLFSQIFCENKKSGNYSETKFRIFAKIIRSIFVSILCGICTPHLKMPSYSRSWLFVSFLYLPSEDDSPWPMWPDSGSSTINQTKTMGRELRRAPTMAGPLWCTLGPLLCC